MIRRIFCISLASLALSATAVLAAVEYPNSERGEDSHSISQYRQLGEVKFKRFIFHIYDAELRVAGSAFSWDQPYALTLTYAREISREKFVEASLAEMARIGEKEAAEVEHFRPPLMACFADVKDGDAITGHSLDANKAIFYFNGEQTCVLEAPGASRAFFSIWLGDKMLDPDRSKKLLGLSS